MNTQTLTTSVATFKYFAMSTDKNIATEQPIRVSTYDYGFDLSEDEVACEMLAPLPTRALTQADAKANIDESESCNLWFLS